MKRRLIPVVAALSVSLISACSDDGTKSTSGVEASKPVGSLSLDERRTFCRWLVDGEYEQISTQLECLPGVVFGTSSKADCESELKVCVAMKSAGREQDHAGRLNACDSAEVDAECTVTVADIETCVRDTFRSTRRYAEALSCDHPMPNTSEWVEPASCDGIRAGCFPSG